MDREITAGWIIDPVAKDAVWAIRGGGTWISDAAGTVTQPARLEKPFTDGTMTAGWKLRGRLERAARELSQPLPKITERYRCVGREYMDIAAGKLDFARYGGLLKPWDHAAGVLIVEEAGGRAQRIDADEPYRLSTKLNSQSLGVCGARAQWDDFAALAIRADELT